MGAKELKSRITNRAVYVKYNPTLVDYVDLKFNQPFKTLLKIEIIRCKFILVWNELLRQTGAVTLRDAKFFYILESLMLNLGVVMSERISTVKLLTEDPYINFEPQVSTTPDMLRLIESYRKLLIFSREHEKQIYDLNDEINLNLIDVEDLIRNQDHVLKRENVAPIKSLGIKAKMDQNQLRLRQGQAVIGVIKATIEDIRRSLPDFIHKFYHTGEEMRKIDNMIDEARHKNINTSARLVHKLINQPKLISFDDHFDAVEKDKKSEREAQDILAAYYREHDLNKVVVYPAKTEPNISNIVQTISKEEPVQYRSALTEPREGFIQRGINRTVEPRGGFFERERPIEYQRTLTEPRADIRRELEEIERRKTEPRLTEVRREREFPREYAKQQEDLGFGGEAARGSQMPNVAEPTKPSITEKIGEKIGLQRERDYERDIDRDIYINNKPSITERIGEKIGIYRDHDRDYDRDIDRDIYKERDVNREIPREYNPDYEYDRDYNRNLTRDREYNRGVIRERDYNRALTASMPLAEEYRYAEGIRTREIPVVPISASAVNEFNKPNSERIREIRGEREFPQEHYVEEPRLLEAERIRSIPETDLTRPTNEPAVSDLRRGAGREFPPELSKSTVDRISDIRREREIKGETSRMQENLRIEEAGRQREIAASAFVKNNNNKPLLSERLSDIPKEQEMRSELARHEAEMRIAELRRKRINEEGLYRSGVAAEKVNDLNLRQDREIAGDYGRTSSEQRTSEIRREIAEIERRISEERLSNLRKEREFPSELNRNRTEYRYKEEGVPGIAEYIKTGTTGPKTQATDTSDIKRESEHEYQRGLNKEQGELKKKKHKKKKQKYENKENIDINRPGEEIRIKTSKMVSEEKNIIPTYLSQKEPYKSSNIKDIRGNTSTNPGVGYNREDLTAEEKLCI